jgi:hypothetical protein
LLLRLWAADLSYAEWAVNCPFSRHCAMVDDYVGIPTAARTSRLRDVLTSLAGLPDSAHSIDMETYNPVAISGAEIGRRGDRVFTGGTERCSPALPA